VDHLSELLRRFPLRAGVFYSGVLCGTYDFDRDTKPGHIHVVKTGRLELVGSSEGKRSIDEPSVIFAPDASTHRLVAGTDAEVLCATVAFGPTSRSPVVGILPTLIVIPLAESHVLTALCEMMFEEAATARIGRQASLNGLCELFVIAVLRTCVEKKLVSGGALAGLADVGLSKALVEMHRDPGREWLLSELAALAGMSRARFAIRFLSVLGATPGDHLASLRVAETQQLLRQGWPLKQVAQKVGYGSASALTRAFTRIIGTAPSQWRLQDLSGDGLRAHVERGPGREPTRHRRLRGAVHMSWGGLAEEYMYKAFWTPFAGQSGAKVKAISPVSLAKIAAAEKIGKVEVDTLDGGSMLTWRAQQQGLLAPIDWTVVGNDRTQEEMHPYGLMFMALSNQIVYNTKKYAAGKGPESMADFWNVRRFPGRRALYKDPRTAIQFALLADGVPRGKLWPLDLDRAFKSLDRIKPHVTIWWEEGNQSQQLFTSGQVDMMQMWNGRVTDLERKGAPIHQVWNDGIIGFSAVMVVKGAPNPANAMKLVEFFGRPRPQAEWAKTMSYGPLNPKAFDFIDAEVARKLPTHPDNLGRQIVSNDEWWAANLDKVSERFNGWLAGR
jgi:putative spermidine/putrescine transport system substrate-binding protein